MISLLFLIVYVSLIFIFDCFQVDPSIMGGMVVNIGDKYIDMSTATKIRKYTDVIKAGI